jgi:hypothetical protein
MKTIITTIIAALALTLPALVSPAAAQIAPGTRMSGRLQAEFSGTVTEISTKKNKSGFRASVTFTGQFESGMPFTATGEIQIATDKLVAVGEDVRGRFRADASGEILTRTQTGVSFSAEGEMFRGGWLTRSQFGGASKQGGTSIFKLEGDMGLSVIGG